MGPSSPLTHRDCPIMSWWGSQDDQTSRSPNPEGGTGKYIPKGARILADRCQGSLEVRKCV